MGGENIYHVVLPVNVTNGRRILESIGSQDMLRILAVGHAEDLIYPVYMLLGHALFEFWNSDVEIVMYCTSFVEWRRPAI